MTEYERYGRITNEINSLLLQYYKDIDYYAYIRDWKNYLKTKAKIKLIRDFRDKIIYIDDIDF